MVSPQLGNDALPEPDVPQPTDAPGTDDDPSTNIGEETAVERDDDDG